MLAVLISTSAIFAPQVEAVPRAPQDFLFGTEKSYVIGPPTVLSQRPIRDLTWSRSGTTIAYVEHAPVPVREWVGRLVESRTPEPEPATFVVRDLRSGKSYRIPNVWPGLERLTRFLGQTNRVLIQKPGEVNGKPRIVQHVVVNPDGIQFQLDVSDLPGAIAVAHPNRSEYYLLSVSESSPHQTTVYSVSSTGKRSQFASVPGYADSVSEDGRFIPFTLYDGARKVLITNSLDLATKQVTRTETELNKLRRGKAEPSAFNGNRFEGESDAFLPAPFAMREEPTRAGLHRIGLGLENQADPISVGNITEAGDFLGMSPTGNFIVYSTEGVTMLREILPVDRKSLERVLAEQARREAMRDAKQAALALIMLASDYDDEFPTANENWRDRANPYIKDRAILDRFTYAFSGGKLSDVKDPAKTVLGHVSIGSGRAIAYVDGHVEWIARF
jgi:prepilin-type processing-associated H-X9-DG protein